MHFRRYILSCVLVLATAVPSFAYVHGRRGPTSTRKHGSSRTAGHAAAPRSIDSERATQIQTALIRTGYLTGTPSGHWDAASEAAMQKLQADNGWQTKLTPDSRALIKLGLGPKEDVAESASLPGVGSPPATQLLPAGSGNGAQP